MLAHLSEFREWVTWEGYFSPYGIYVGIAVFIISVCTSVTIHWIRVIHNPMRMPILCFYIYYHLFGAGALGLPSVFITYYSVFVYQKVKYGETFHSERYYNFHNLPLPEHLKKQTLTP